MPASDLDQWRPKRILAFLCLGLALYAGLFAWSERLVRLTGDRNPFFRIAQAPPDQDWIILGASHAMPLDFADAEVLPETASGTRILNLSATGTGPFVWRLIAERYFADHVSARVLIVVDDFAFRSRAWNENRIGDSDFLPRVPWDVRTLRLFAAAAPQGLSAKTLVNYASGFSKINNRDRMKADVWEAEGQFERSPRPSDAADRARTAYLYPAADDISAQRYLDDLRKTAKLAREHGTAVVLVRPPLPERFRRLLPDETSLNAGLAMLAGEPGVQLRDFSALLPEPRYYLDSDHLNRAGVMAWVDGGLGTLLAGR